MAGTGHEELETSPRTIEIIGPEVPDSGWQRIELAPTMGTLAGARGDLNWPKRLSAVGSASVVRFPAPLISLSGTATQELVRRVPNSAFVSIGWRLGSAVPRIPALRSRFANDNVSTGRGRSMWRDLFFLAVLAATVAGAFWSGRIQGYQKVIVVPEPSNSRHVMT